MDIELSYNEYKILTEQSPILIWRANTEKECDYFNEIWLEFTGRTMEEEYGFGWAEGVHKEDFDRCLEIYTNAFDKRESFEMEYRLKRFDGEYRWIFDRGAPFFDDNGTFMGYIGSCVDVHARKLAEIENEKKINLAGKLIPICAWCSNIRKDDGYWDRISQYLHSETDLKLTHGICPECVEQEVTV